MSALTRLLVLAGAGIGARRLVQQRSGGASSGAAAPHVDASVTIDRPPAVVFRFWSDPTQLARAVGDFATAETLDPERARWVLRGPAGLKLSFESVVSERSEPDLIRFRSGPRAPVGFTGEVRFDEAGPGRTELRLRGDARLPGARVAERLAGLLGDVPDRAFAAGLRRLADRLEAQPAP